MNDVKKRALVVGLVSNVAFALLFLFFGLTYHQLNNVGWDGGGGCSTCALQSNLAGMNVNYPSVIRLNSSEAVRIETFTHDLRPQESGCPLPKDMETTFDYEASLWTSGPELSPSSPQKTTGPRSSRAEWVWIVHPKEPGTYSFHAEMSVKVGNCQVSKLSDTFQIRVVNLFGLSAWQVQIFSLLGFILGTSLTVPGFIALWIQYRDRKEAKAAAAAKAAKEAEEQKSKRKVIIITSSSGEEKELEVDDQTGKGKSGPSSNLPGK